MGTMKRENEVVPVDPQSNHSVYFSISDSGQTGSYTGTFGEDHDYTSLPAQSFTDHGNGTISDNITGLLWTKCSMGENNLMDSSNDCSEVHGQYSWYDANAACENLVHGGWSNWRLPDYSELFSLLDFGRTGINASAINNTYFPNTEFQDCYDQGVMWGTLITQAYLLTIKYWTATEFTDLNYAHYISFDDGYSNVDSQSANNFLRCVSDQ